MSEKPRDEQLLEEFLTRRDALSRRYREAAAEQPSAALDDAILAAARRAAGARPQPAGWRRAARWQAPLAAAAVIVLAVTMTVMLEREPAVNDPGRLAREKPVAPVPAAPAPATSAASVPPAATPERAKRAAAAPPPSSERTAPTPGRAAEAGEAGVTAPASAPPHEAIAPMAAVGPSASQADELKESAPAPSARRELAAGDAGQSAVEAQTRLREIEADYAQEQLESADRALAAFCRDYPGYPLPESLAAAARRLAPACDANR